MNHIKINEVPQEERPYEKCLSMGVGALTDTELLAILIHSGTKEKSAIELARHLLKRPGSNGLSSLVHITIQELMQIHGIGKVKAVQIISAIEMSKRIARREALGNACLDHPSVIAELYMSDLQHCPVEQVWLTALDTKNHLLARELLSQGTVNSSIISPREIFLCAMKYRAVSVVLVHNHPSGDPTPSREDIQMTMRVMLAGEMLGIMLLDHIIIGNRTYYSMKEQGCFDEKKTGF